MTNERTHTPPLLAVSLLITLIACVMLAAFAWPAVRTSPNKLPVAVVAPAPVLQRLQAGIERAKPGAFELHQKASVEAARDAILNREVYGAILVTPQGPKVLTASAASPMVAQLLSQLPGLLTAQGNNAVEDVVPATLEDPRQAGLSGTALPLIFCSSLGTILLGRFFARSRTRLAGMLLVAAFGGLGVTAMLQYWFGTLSGNYFLNSTVVAAGITSIAVFLLGLERLLGTPGLSVGVTVMMLLGNPFSALTSAPQLLPSGWGAFGQLLPPGAFGTLLRSVAFFDGAGALPPTLTLGAWILGGLGLILLGSVRQKTMRSEVTPTLSVAR